MPSTCTAAGHFSFIQSVQSKVTVMNWAAWAAVRSIGEAVTRTNSAEPDSVRDFLFSDRFELGGFKGRKVTTCSFCGKTSREVGPMVEGPGEVYVCHNCVELCQNITVPVIASGGLTNLDDIRRLCEVADEGIEGAITGRAIYEGSLDFKEAQDLADKLSAA